MSTSEKQLNANRQNAQKSTGPITETGKKASSQNAVKHGLHSCQIAINSPRLKEDATEYEILVASLFDEHQPRSPLQEHLVYKIANCMWRYRRLISAETAEINRQLQPHDTFLIDKENYFEHFENSGELEDLLNSRTIPTGETANRFLRYEWRLNRELHHAYTLLRLLKIMEKAEAKSENALTVLSQTEPVLSEALVPNLTCRMGDEGPIESDSPQNHYNHKQI